MRDEPVADDEAARRAAKFARFAQLSRDEYHNRYRVEQAARGFAEKMRAAGNPGAITMFEADRYRPGGWPGTLGNRFQRSRIAASRRNIRALSRSFRSDGVPGWLFQVRTGIAATDARYRGTYFAVLSDHRVVITTGGVQSLALVMVSRRPRRFRYGWTPDMKFAMFQDRVDLEELELLANDMTGPLGEILRRHIPPG